MKPLPPAAAASNGSGSSLVPKRTVSLAAAESQLNQMTDDERRALRASKFAQQDVSSVRRKESNPGGQWGEGVASNGKGGSRIAHPGGPIVTNKAAALARFLQQRMASGEINRLPPELVENAVRNAQATLESGVGVSGAPVKHVMAFEDKEVPDTTDASKEGKNMKGGMKKKKKHKHKKLFQREAKESLGVKFNRRKKK